MRALAFVLALVALASSAQAERLRLAVTTSFQNSGLADVLLPAIAEELGLEVQLLVVGTGQALALGRAGDVDAVLVHAPEAETAFVAEGAATHRREIMFNDFVLVGPASDPVGLRSIATITEAMNAIAREGGLFVSRGDDSGTHQKEVDLWFAAGLNPEGFGPHYRSVGAGMGAALNIAAAMEAYCLTDRASWLSFGNRGTLALLFEGDPALFNQYSYLPINPARHPHVAAEAAAALEAWLVSDRARALIEGYRIDGQQLFTVNAR